MDFELTDEQGFLRQSARDFLATECNSQVVRRLETSETGHSPELWKKMAELGWTGIWLPESFGGAGWGLLGTAVLFEELGRAAFDCPLFASFMGSQAILLGGSEKQQESLLPAVCKGETILSLAWAEPRVVSDPRYVELSAKRKGRDFRLSGSKLCVPYALVADRVVVAARTRGKAGDEAGLSLFLVDRQSPGLEISELRTIAPDKQYRLEFEDVRVSAADVIGELHDGYAVLRALIDHGAALQCAEMVGGAERGLEVTAAYTKQREQFGRPLGTFQAVQHRLADMYTDVQGARWTAYQAISRMDSGKPVARELAIARSFTSEAAQRVAFGAQQLHGGAGVDVENDLHFYYRRAKALELRVGGSAVGLQALECALDG